MKQPVALSGSIQISRNSLRGRVQKDHNRSQGEEGGSTKDHIGSQGVQQKWPMKAMNTSHIFLNLHQMSFKIYGGGGGGGGGKNAQFEMNII